MQMRLIPRLCLTVLFLSGCFLEQGMGAEKGDEGDESKISPSEQGPDGLPKFRHPYTDGLYSTVTAMNTFNAPEVAKQKKLKLKVAGFRKEIPVYAIMQNHPAPLVVVLMGIDGKVDGPWGGLYPYWYDEASKFQEPGFHVLTFDGTFSPRYSEISGLGVVGNFEAESEQVAAVIDAFLKLPENSKSITKVGVLGMSFGATQALLLAARAKAGHLPFELSGCLALSPLVKFRASARIVDRYFAEDRWDTTMVELAKRFLPHVPVAEGQPIPFSATEMRAAIGFAFRDGLAKVVERNDSYYKLKVLPSEESGENRVTYAEATGLERFIDTLTFPYWNKKGTVKSADDLWNMGDLSKIIPRLPDFAEIVVAENDPFNTPEDLAEAKAVDVRKCLTVLPRGGHLGFLAADWTLVKALRIFRSSIDKQQGGTPEQKEK